MKTIVIYWSELKLRFSLCRPYFPFISLENKVKILHEKWQFSWNRKVSGIEIVSCITSDVRLTLRSKFQSDRWTLSVLLPYHWWKDQNVNLKIIFDTWLWKVVMVSRDITFTNVAKDLTLLRGVMKTYVFWALPSPTKILQSQPILTYYTSMKSISPLEFDSRSQTNFWHSEKTFYNLLII